MEKKNQATAVVPVSPAWADLKEQSVLAFNSGLLPKAIDTKEKAVAVAMMGRDLGLSPMQSLCGLYVVNGMVTLRAGLMLRLIYERVPGAQITVLTPPEKADRECSVRMQRPGGTAMEFRYTLEDAKKGGFLSKPIWNQHTSTMLRWAAIRTGARIVFADAIAGCYLEDEVPAVHGRKEVETIDAAPQFAPAPHPVTGEVQEAEVVEPKPVEAPKSEPPKNSALPASEAGKITDKQRKRMFAIANKANWPEEELKKYLRMELKVPDEAEFSSKDVPWRDYDRICKFIEAHPYPANVMDEEDDAEFSDDDVPV